MSNKDIHTEGGISKKKKMWFGTHPALEFVFTSRRLKDENHISELFCKNSSLANNNYFVSLFNIL